MFIIFLVVISYAQIFDCPISNTSDCIDTYKPVCGLNFTEQVIGTYSNSCQACKSIGVLKFTEGNCQTAPLSGGQITPPYTSLEPLDNHTLTYNYTRLTMCTEPRPSVCTLIAKPTCALFDRTIPCTGDNCRQEFLNECAACSNSSVKSYFHGNCSQYIPKPEIPTIQYCKTSSRPTECLVDESLETCGFLDDSAICLSPPCLQPFSNPCRACQQANITSFYQGSCSNYKGLFKVASQEKEIITANYSYCQANRPESCEQFNKESSQTQTCGIIKQCKGNDCQRSFSNKCEACKNYLIEGYYEGVCKGQYLMHLALILAILSIIIV